MAVPQLQDSARAGLAPGGRLRAALNYSNTLLISARTPAHTGVAPDLARELARRAGANVEFVGYANAGLVADAAARNEWDVAFIGAEPQRAGDITFARAAYTLFLQRTLRRAALVEAESLPAAFDLFIEKKFEVLAGLKPNLIANAQKVPGLRLLDGRFTTVQQAIGVPRSRAAAAAYLAEFVAEITRSGLLRDLIARHRVEGLSIVTG